MRNSGRAAVLCALALAPLGDARGETVDATIMTLVSGRQDARDGNLYTAVPVIQSVAIDVSDLQLRYVQDVKLVVSGWGALTLASSPLYEGGTGDLDLGFVEGKLLDRRLE